MSNIGQFLDQRTPTSLSFIDPEALTNFDFFTGRRAVKSTKKKSKTGAQKKAASRLASEKNRRGDITHPRKGRSRGALINRPSARSATLLGG